MSGWTPPPHTHTLCYWLCGYFTRNVVFYIPALAAPGYEHERVWWSLLSESSLFWCLWGHTINTSMFRARLQVCVCALVMRKAGKEETVVEQFLCHVGSGTCDSTSDGGSRTPVSARYSSTVLKRERGECDLIIINAKPVHCIQAVQSDHKLCFVDHLHVAAWSLIND